MGGATADEGLGGWSPDSVAALQAMGSERRYKKGAVLLLQGEPAATVHVLVEGLVKVVKTTRSGHELLLALAGPHELMGHFEALDGRGLCWASVVALEPTVTRAMGADQFVEFLATHPPASLDAIRSVIHQLVRADRLRVDAALTDVAHRLASLLAELARDHGRATADGTEIGLALSQDEIASMVGASRDSVTRALTSLRARGMVVTKRRAMTILDVDALRTFAAEGSDWD